MKLALLTLLTLGIAWHQAGSQIVAAKVNGFQTPSGQPAHTELPEERHLANVGGKDGAGLCVFTSIWMAADHQQETSLAPAGSKPGEGFRAWMQRQPGGGYPEKVRKMIAAYCREKNLQEPEYIQVEGGDLEILKLACKTGRMASVTYSWSPTGRYGGRKIAHMVNLVHGDDQWFGILDNNHVGENAIEWMTPAEFKRTYTGIGGGWSVILLNPGAPPATP